MTRLVLWWRARRAVVPYSAGRRFEPATELAERVRAAHVRQQHRVPCGDAWVPCSLEEALNPPARERAA